MNPADLANLINDFATKPKATLFCGAGVGCRVGFPTWPKYLYTLASVCSEYGDNAATTLIQSWIKGGNYLGAASVYKNTSIPLGEKYRKLAEPFGANPSSETLELLKPLVCLPFSAIVSTNYDRSLADAYAKFRGRCPVLVAPGPTMKNAAMLNDFYFARIHGTVETPDSIIISSEDFSKTKSDKCYVDFVCTLLRHRPVMFIGFSFLDPAINSILEIVEKEVAPHYSYEHLAILPSDAHPTLKQFLHKINIRTESYDGSQERQDLWRSVRLAYESTKGAQMTWVHFLVLRRFRQGNWLMVADLDSA